MGLLAVPIARVLVLVTAIAGMALQSSAQGLSGRWMYEEQGESLVLEILHDLQSGRITGSLTMLGATVEIEGRARGTTLVIESMGGIPTAASGSSLTARLNGPALVLTVAAGGEAAKTVTMTRAGGRGEATSPPAPRPAPDKRPVALPPPSGRAASAEPGDFAGHWEVVSDDRTRTDVLKLEVAGGAVTGTFAELERGYFSGRQTVKSQYGIRGSARNGTLEATLSDASGQNRPFSATFVRRGEYIVMRQGQYERGLARPGHAVVASAEGSLEAEALARAVAGRVYSVSSQASGRGAFVGGRRRLAICADGRIEFDASDVAATPGALPGQDVDLGSTVARRGTWSIVMLAGAPAVRAQWHGTGTSYSLTRYFVIRPSADGRSAVVDGTELPVIGRC